VYLNTRTPGWKSEDGATSQQGEGFPWLFSVLEQILSLCPQSKLHFLFLKQPSSTLTSKFSRKRSLHSAIKISSQCPPNSKLSPNAHLHSSAPYFPQSTSQHATFFTSPRFTTFPPHLCQKDERTPPGNLQNSNHFCPP